MLRTTSACVDQSALSSNLQLDLETERVELNTESEIQSEGDSTTELSVSHRNQSQEEKVIAKPLEPKPDSSSDYR